MAITAKELRKWLVTFADDDLVAIDEGGLEILLVRNQNIYLEIGGIPEED